jgi:hypothetical protein
LIWYLINEMLCKMAKILKDYHGSAEAGRTESFSCAFGAKRSSPCFQVSVFPW